MRRIVLSRFADIAGGLACVEAPEPPTPGPGEATIELVAFAVHPADLLLVDGKYLVNPTLPVTPGMEASARIIATGPGVDDLTPGDMVLPLTRQCWTERKTVARDELVRLDQSIDSIQLAMVRINGLTAQMMLERARGQSQTTFVLQNAANSVVGRFVDALAPGLDLRAVNVVRSEAVADGLRARGVEAIVSNDRLKDAIRETIGGGRLAFAFDAIGGQATGELAACLDPEGKVLVYGRLSHDPISIPGEEVVYRGVSVEGFSISRSAPNRVTPEIVKAFAAIEKVMLDGFRNDIEAVYPMERVAEAVAHSMRSGRAGKIIVTPDRHETPPATVPHE